MNLKQLTLAAGAVAMLGLAPVTADAGPLTDVDLLDGSGGTLASNVREMDWTSSSAGLAIGIGPFGAPLAVGQTFDFVYQSILTGATDPGGGAVSFASTLNSSGTGGALAGTEYQFTIVARFQEVVTAVLGGGTSAIFGLGGAGGTISIFYDEVGLGGGGTEASIAAGTGYDDGTEVARFSLVSQTSTFTATTGSSGVGVATLDAQVQAALDFVLDEFILGLIDTVFDLEFFGTLQFPPTPPAANTTDFHVGGSAFYPDTAVAANDILFQVDGNNTFSIVPEPVNLLLFGIGLLVLGVFSRKRLTAV
ncbi:PEP-CTERM sorting domain-containing protein [Pelagibius sp.]|uniref:PEP-CTERM sorting domain-containing protein n=1 Tax=Pelagibius sp. TaxID=1931238 RepID=UPI00261620AA|nr:PEP-CTERM sorting domain-containing protein [Pelagibius sp.]